MISIVNSTSVSRQWRARNWGAQWSRSRYTPCQSPYFLFLYFPAISLSPWSFVSISLTRLNRRVVFLFFLPCSVFRSVCVGCTLPPPSRTNDYRTLIAHTVRVNSLRDSGERSATGRFLGIRAEFRGRGSTNQPIGTGNCPADDSLDAWFFLSLSPLRRRGSRDYLCHLPFSRWCSLLAPTYLCQRMSAKNCFRQRATCRVYLRDSCLVDYPDENNAFDRRTIP